MCVSLSHFLLLYRIGFVTQEDVLFPQLTVEETLIFSAFLRLPTNMSKQQKYARVETTVKELGLERCVYSMNIHLKFDLTYMIIECINKLQVPL